METAKTKTSVEITVRVAERIDNFERYSHPHSSLMADLAARLARRFGLIEEDIIAISDAARLHDIGLFAMAPPYLATPGPLSLEDRIDLWRHPIIGEQQMARRNANRHAQLLVRWHHERWNGTGYPDMLSFEDIPIGARILRVVELYSALTSDRPYRPALGEEQAREALRSSAGLECDPIVVGAALALLDGLRPQAEQPAPPEQHVQELQFPLLPGQSIEAVDIAAPEPAVPEEAKLDPGPVSLDADEPAPPLKFTSSRCNMESLLGFQASVLRQLEFKSIAMPLCGWGRLVSYLKTWGKVIQANDPRAWAAAAARAAIEVSEPLTAEQIGALLEDVYVPGFRLRNPELRRWFGEADSWWLDNLRQRISALTDDLLAAHAIVLGIQSGDYARSFSDDTLDLKRPLTSVFRQLASARIDSMPAHPWNQATNLPVVEFIRAKQADVLYLNLPSGQAETVGTLARSDWRDSWVRGETPSGPDDVRALTTLPQSKQAYLSKIDSLLAEAGRFKTWAIEYRDAGLASARDISELIKLHRPVHSTYSKDLTEVAGGLRNYIILAESA